MDELLDAVNSGRVVIRPEHVHELMTEQEAAAYLGVSVSGMRKWRAHQSGPSYAKLGRIIRYRKSDLDAFVESRITVVEPVVQE